MENLQQIEEKIEKKRQKRAELEKLLEGEQKISTTSGAVKVNTALPLQQISQQNNYSDSINQQLNQDILQQQKVIKAYEGRDDKSNLDYLLNNVFSSKTQKRIQKHEQIYADMFGNSDTDYDTDYDQYNTQEQKYIKPYGDLTKRWAEAGGAIKYDKYGKPTLDIKKQLQLSKENANEPDPFTLLRFSLPKGGYNREDAEQYYKDRAEIYKEGKKRKNEEIKSIDTAYLTPEERRELNKYKEELIDAGIIGQNRVEYNKQRKSMEPIQEKSEGLPYVGRGGAKILDTLGEIIRRVVSFEDIGLNMAGSDNDIETTEQKYKKDVEGSPVTKIYDRAFGTAEPRTTTGRILQNVGEFLSLPTGGGIKVALNSAIGASVGLEAINQLYDWASLSNEEKVQELQTKPSLAKTVIGLAGAILGDRSMNSLVNNLKTLKGRKVEVDLTEAKTLQEKFKNDGAFEEDLFDKQRENIVKNIKDELYKPQGFFENIETIKNKKLSDIQTAEVMFKRSTATRNNEKIKEIIDKYSNGQTVKLKPTFVLAPDTETIGKIESLLAKARGGTQERDLLENIKDETVQPFKEHIKKSSEEAGKAYEESIKGLPEEKIESSKILENITDKIKSNVASPAQEKICSYYLNKIKESKNVGNLISINKEINQDIYSTSDDGIKYTLGQVKDGIKQYIKDESTNKEQFKKLLQANEEYSTAKEAIDEKRAILDNLHGGRDRYSKAENRELGKSSVAFKGYLELTPEEQKVLLANLPEEQANAFRKINLHKLKSEDFGRYSDIELENAFGKEMFPEAQGYSKRLADFSSKGSSNSQITQQAFKEYLDGKIPQNELENIITDLKKGLKPEGQTMIDDLFKQITEEQQLFKQAEFMPYLRDGDINKTAKNIKSIEDVNALNSIKENIYKNFGERNKDAKAIDNFIMEVKNIKKQEIVDDIQNILERNNNFIDTPESFIKNIDNFGEYIAKNKEMINILYDNDKSIKENLDYLINECLPKQKQMFEEAKQIASNMAEQCKEYAKYTEIKEKLTKKAQEDIKFFNTHDALRAFIAHSFTQTWWFSLLTYGLAYSYRKISQSMARKNLNKLKENPKFFKKKILEQQKDYKKTYELANNIYKDIVKSVAIKDYTKIIVGTENDKKNV